MDVGQAIHCTRTNRSVEPAYERNTHQHKETTSDPHQLQAWSVQHLRPLDNGSPLPEPRQHRHGMGLCDCRLMQLGPNYNKSEGSHRMKNRTKPTNQAEGLLRSYGT